MADDQRQPEIALLVAAGRAGDSDAFRQLVQMHQRQAMALAVGILGNVHDAAEVVQEAFVKGYMGLEGLSEPERFPGWLLRIVTNEAISRRRAMRRRAAMMRLVAARTDRRVAEPDENERAASLQAAVEQAMRQLTDKEARALASSVLNGLPHKETARILGCSAEAVRWHVFRARQKLRILLKDYLE